MWKYIKFAFLVVIVTEASGISVENQQELDTFETTNFDVQQMGCPKIRDLKPLAYPKSLIGYWRVPYLSSSWVHGVANSMHQSTLKNTGLEKVCIKVAVLPMPAWKNDTNSTIWVVTKCPKTGRTYELACQPTETVDSEWTCLNSNAVAKEGNSKAGKSYVYIYQDEVGGLSYALVIECLPKSWIHWAIVTKEKVVDPKIIKHFIEQLKNMGFNMDHPIELSTGKC